MVASGQVSSGYQEASVHIWLIESLQTIAIIEQLDGNPVSTAFSALDFVLLTVEVGENENSVSFWDWESDALLGRVQLNEEHLTGGLFHPRESDLAVTFGMHHLAFWRRKKDGFLTRIDALAPGHSGRTILSWAFVGETGLAVGDTTGYITVWALLPGDAFRIIKEIKAHQDDLRVEQSAGIWIFLQLFIFNAMVDVFNSIVDNTGFSFRSLNNAIKCYPCACILFQLRSSLFEVFQKKNVSNGMKHGEVRSLLATQEGTLISGGQNQLKAWDSHQRFQQLAAVDFTEGDIRALQFQKEGGAALYVGTNNAISEGTMQSSFSILIQVDTICVGFHPEGRAITAGGTNGKLLVLHSDGGSVVATIFVADAALKALAYNTDGSVLAVGCEDGNVYICGSKNRGYLYKIHAVLKNEWPILQIDWSDDGEYLQSCYRKEDFCEVALWKVAESKRITSALSQNRNWPQHTCTLSHNILGIWKRIEGVFYLSCHRNGSKLATGAKDGFIRIYPYPYPEADQVQYQEQKNGPRAVNSVRFLNMSNLISCSGQAIYAWNIKK
ncbi:echinoderm microtubule-associated protein-like CG42247 [Trichonephila clavata]|uniref:Echinoderm microtubule-associated protein-like CG42247 n=1 Tax=Trichonephila clavata TaxID=2740835 RepID=A0A8X6FVD2_TRICU|nr:echinoderm microtubule-associated protein-like CG42247 [Trichonephila clavata]